MKRYRVYQTETGELYYEGPEKNRKNAVSKALQNFTKKNQRRPGWQDNFECFEC